MFIRPNRTSVWPYNVKSANICSITGRLPSWVYIRCVQYDIGVKNYNKLFTKQRLRTYPKTHACVHIHIVTCGRICTITMYVCVCIIIIIKFEAYLLNTNKKY